ncbi:tyrosine-type recombinase/integrase [Croceibacterium ferulae]|uniref:tyrosine-type recombinase/integrase n=1 Tax=Croceibacterium ferulae TaxID=1854641 RepID=UPI000EB4B916|nr:tyrosine-type recombinase/integrase [Croceibacterium ferulae]
MPETALVPSVATAIRDLVADVRALAPKHAAIDPALVVAAVRGWSANTQRAFRSDLALWDRWCRALQVRPANADGGTVAAWIQALSGEGAPSTSAKAAVGAVRKPATIARYLVQVGTAYRLAGLLDPTAAPIVRLELKAMRKRLGVRQKQALALRYKGEVADLAEPPKGPCVATLLRATRRDWLGARDRALLGVAYDTGCRRSELVAIRVDHVSVEPDGSGLLEIPTSKTDRAGEGALAYLSPRTMEAIRAWRKAAEITSGPLLRRVECHADGSVRQVGEAGLHANSITLIYRRLIRDAHAKKLLGPISEAELVRYLREVTSHSIRVGVAQDNFAAGESLPAIMQAYRWRDARTVMRYGSRLAARSGASARLAERFNDV